MKSIEEVITGVRTGEYTAEEAVAEQLTRIAALNPRFNAITQLFDARPAEGPLSGVVFTVKDNIDVAGYATTHGLARFAGMTKQHDAPIVARLRAAGATPAGHTNLPTLTLRGMHTCSELYGHTVNPWDETRTPGGTSGGDAVAVATGMAPLGIGNDSGGSLRLPALFTGTCGLKPTVGRYPSDHRFGADDPSLASQVIPVDGPITRTIADLRLVHGLLCGADPADPRTVPAPVTGPPVPKTVGFVPGDPSVEAAAARLTEAGYTVEPVEAPRVDEALDTYGGLIMTEFAQSWPAISALVGPESSRYIELSMARREPADLAEYLRLTGVRLNIQRTWTRFLQRYPLLLGPVSTVPWFEIDQESRNEEEFARYGDAIALCTVTSLVGVPAVAVPTGLRDGFPTGVQLIGRMYREDTCLDAAEILEESAPLTNLREE